ncbi:oligosaccharide flippase family protein [candidate division KSB1 bacterium]|nr:oligosaccharide flippase family protein [candidate division KSB1 bacterium]
MSFLKKTFGTFGSQIAMVLFGLLNNALVANLLGSEGQGNFAFYMLVPTMLVMLGNLGINTANVYYVGSKKYPRDLLAGQSLLMALGLGLVLIPGFFILSPFLGVKQDPGLYRVIWMVPFGLLTLYISHLFLGLNEIKYYNLSAILPKFYLLINLIVLIFMMKTGIPGTALAFLLAEIITALSVFGLYFFRFKKEKLDLSFKWSVIKDLLQFGIQSFIANVLTFLNSRLDMFLIVFFLNRKELGFYTIAVLLVEKIWLIPHAIATVLLPHVTVNHEQQLTPVVCRNSLLLTFLVALFMFLISKWLIALIFIPEFMASVLPLRILLPGIVILGIPKILSADLMGRGKPIYAAITAIITIIVNLTLNWLFIPRLHIVGAALSASISYTISAILLIYFYRQVSGIPLHQFLIIQGSDWLIYKKLYLKFLKKSKSKNEI